MTEWPVVGREPVLLPTLQGHDDELWNVLIELASLRPNEWTLIGGQMVYLHALEQGETPPRVSTDLDVLVNARIVTGGMRAFVADLVSRGFGMDGSSPDRVAHRYRREGVSIDVLAPEGLGARVDLTTTPPNYTVRVPGGTQALARTQLLPVRTNSRQGMVPRPSLLGAVIAKAEAVEVDDAPETQRMDLVFLLALVEDPFEIAETLTPKDKERIRRRQELTSDRHPAWGSLTPVQRDRARAAFTILCG
jgi:hypothetical protein